MKLKIKDGQTIVCIGDSITDCGRRGAASPLGSGYVKYLRDLAMATAPERNINVINKGIGGNMVYDLRQRWDDDVTYHKPDWLTVLVGINDLHRVIGQGVNWQEATPEKYRQYYDEILTMARKRSQCGIVLMEPFYISRDDSGAWRSKVLKDLESYRKIVAEMSRKYKTGLIKLQDIFVNQLKYRDADTFCAEPVHPNEAGHLVIARNLFHSLVE